ncbi:MAG: ASCH domain-containing protein [Acidobacteria bacterium]|nr:ASCH domain-containing protein [Acidobacteriota bacterium]
MKALSMVAPYGQLIRDGKKTIETRTWKPPYLGPVLFVCSKTVPCPEAGMALCVADVTGFRKMIEADEVRACCLTYGMAWSWFLSNVRRVKPFPVRGWLGLFDVPDELIQEMRDE